MTKSEIERAREEAIAAYKRKHIKPEKGRHPIWTVLDENLPKVFAAGFDAAVKALTE